MRLLWKNSGSMKNRSRLAAKNSNIDTCRKGEHLGSKAGLPNQGAKASHDVTFKVCRVGSRVGKFCRGEGKTSEMAGMELSGEHVGKSYHIDS